MLTFDANKIATLHNKIWISHDLRDFNKLRKATKAMARLIGFENSERIGELVKECYFLHSLLDDGKFNQISNIFSCDVENRDIAEKLIFRALKPKFEEIYLLSERNLPSIQASLQAKWWYYFSRKDIPELLRLSLVAKPFFKQQMIKVNSKKHGLILGLILGKAGYYHNRDSQKTEKLLESYWSKVIELDKKLMMF